MGEPAAACFLEEEGESSSIGALTDASSVIFSVATGAGKGAEDIGGVDGIAEISADIHAMRARILAATAPFGALSKRPFKLSMSAFIRAR